MRIQFWHLPFVCEEGFGIENVLLSKEKLAEDLRLEVFFAMCIITR